MLPEGNVWQFLNDIQPIEDLPHLALHTAQITVGMGEILARLEALERKANQ